MGQVNIKKRGNVYQYQFEIAKVNGKRKYINKSGFKTKNEAIEAVTKHIQNILMQVFHLKNVLFHIVII